LLSSNINLPEKNHNF